MNAAYVDTSCLVSIVFGEQESDVLAQRLREFDLLISSNLTEAELRTTLAREELPTDASVLQGVTWVLPDRPLSREITTVTSTGWGS